MFKPAIASIGALLCVAANLLAQSSAVDTVLPFPSPAGSFPAQYRLFLQGNQSISSVGAYVSTSNNRPYEIIVRPGSPIEISFSYGIAFDGFITDIFTPLAESQGIELQGRLFQAYVAWTSEALSNGAPASNVLLAEFFVTYKVIPLPPHGEGVAFFNTFTQGAIQGVRNFSTLAPIVPGTYYIGGVTGQGNINGALPATPSSTYLARVIVASDIPCPPCPDPEPYCFGDANNDDQVTFSDITTVLMNFSTLCP